MAETLAPTGFTSDTFEAFLARRDEPAWLVEQRRKAWEQFESLNLPRRDEEEWRRTDVRLLRLQKFAPPFEAPAATDSPATTLSAGVALGGQSTALNSMPLADRLAEKWSQRGVLFGSLDQLAVEHPELVQSWLMQQAFDPGYDKFAALHAACWSGGTLLYVPKGVVVDEPLHMVAGLTSGGVDFGHTLVVLEEGAEATLLSETVSGEGEGLHCGGTELLIGAGAKLRFVSLQHWGSGVWHFAHQKARLQRDSQLQWTIGALGSRLAKVNQHVALAGRGAHAQVNGVMFTEGKQHLSYHTLQHHEVESCRSDLLYKGALQDSSRLVWRGMIKVDPGAQKTDAYQRNDNLILSEEARADSIPGLEIEADDVRCTHGATAGRVDDEQIFYARCRGLTRKEAVRMIVAGFFQQVFDRITIESVREALGGAIGRKIREYE